MGVGEDVGGVYELVDGAEVGEGENGRVLDGVADDGDELTGEDEIRPFMEIAGIGVDWFGDLELIVEFGREFVGLGEGGFTGAPVGGGENGREDRPEAVSVGELLESGTEPFGVGRILFFHEETEAHQIFDLAAGD